jgi:hypothetical protein
MTSSNYIFYFKVVYTTRTISYSVDPNLSIEDFIQDIQNRVRVDLNIDPNDMIEIVEAGNFYNIIHRDAEMAPALEPSSETLLQVYGDRHATTAFYIRPV